MPRYSHQRTAKFASAKSELAHEIGGRISARRKKLGLTQDDLISLVEANGGLISRSQLSRIENGVSVPDAIQILHLASALEVSAEFILSGRTHRSQQ